MKEDILVKSIVANSLKLATQRSATEEQRAAAARWLARLDQIEAVATAPEPPAPDGTATGHAA